ncbi:hypothetical protein FACS1894191_6590 [Clostridia bacterium]|nr:hypothetical protein FACS1894191_6590 [Clostridia bacterium]
MQLGNAERRLEIGKAYRHFKGNYYLVEAVARDSESEQDLVIYRPLYETEAELYARPIEMFLGEVDHEKYPDIEQKWRFERVDL